VTGCPTPDTHTLCTAKRPLSGFHQLNGKLGPGSWGPTGAEGSAKQQLRIQQTGKLMLVCIVTAAGLRGENVNGGEHKRSGWQKMEGTAGHDADLWRASKCTAEVAQRASTSL